MKRSSALRRIGWYLALALIFTGAAWLRFSLPRWPFADGDSWGYLRPVVLKLSGGFFAHTYGRNFLYPAFLLLICAPAKTFAAIPVVQHLLGLATGALLLACWHSMRRFLRALPLFLHSLGGLALLSVYLFSRTPLTFEHLIRPEAVTPFFAILSLWLVLKFFDRDRSPALGAAVLLTTVIFATLKSNFALAAAVIALPVAFALVRSRGPLLPRAAAIALPLVLALTFFVTERALARSDPMSRQFLPTLLFTVHANVIVREMDAEIAQGDCRPYQCDWLREVAASLHAEMADSWRYGKQYRSFGFDPDYLFFHDPNFTAWRSRFFESSEAQELKFFRTWYWRAVRNQPLAMKRKVLQQLAIFYSPLNPSFSLRRSEALATLYNRTLDAFAGHETEVAASPPLRHYLQEARKLTTSSGALKQTWLVIIANFFLALAYLPILLGLLACAVALAFRRNLRSRYGTLASAALLVFSCNFATSLVAAVMVSLHIGRYNVTQFPFSLLAVFLGALLLAEIASTLLVRRFV